MASGLIIIPNYMPALDSNGDPYPGAKIYFYLNETTTPTTVYSDVDLTVPLSQPVVANNAGEFVPIYADRDLLFSAAVTTSAGVPLLTVSGISPTYALAPVVQTVTEGDSVHAPSSDAVYTQLQLQVPVPASRYGVTGNGTTNDLAALTTAVASSSMLSMATGTYKINSDFIPDAKDITLLSDPNVKFTTNQANFKNFLTFQRNPIFAHNLFRKTYENADWAGYENAFLIAAHAVTKANRGAPDQGPAVVALYGCGETQGAGSTGWGANLVGISNYSGALAIGVEVNTDVMVSDGTAVGVSIHASGTYQSYKAMQIASNTVGSTYQKGICFDYALAPDGITVISACSEEYIRVNGGSGTSFISIAAGTFTSAEWISSNLIIGPSQDTTATYSYLRIDGHDGTHPRLSSKITSGANCNLDYATQGGGGHLFFTNAGASEAVQFAVVHSSSAVDYLAVLGGIGSATLTMLGSNSAPNMNYTTKSNGSHVFSTRYGSEKTQFTVVDGGGSVVDYATVSGGAGAAVFSVDGTTANANILFQGKGSGGALLRDGGGISRFLCNTTGVGFNSTSPIAKPTLSAALSTGGAETNANICIAINAIRTALINYGLCV